VSRLLHPPVSSTSSKAALKPAKPKPAIDTMRLETKVAELTRTNQALNRQIRALEKQISDIHDQTFLDPITRLPNRQLLIDRLQLAISNSARNGQEGAVLYLDLDHFKLMNDTYGHHFGNLLLQQVAERLVTNVRVSDTVAHVGSDEFVIVFQSLGKHNLKAATHARKIARKLQDVLSKPYRLESIPYICTASVGIMLFNPPVIKAEDLIQQSALAMYQAKKSGRNGYQFYDPEMQKAIQARATLEDELRVALEKQQFQLYFQVQVNSAGIPIGAESLIRWVHPERGVISPMEFIPLCEETGMIVPIGNWVLNAACEQLATWQKHASTRNLVLAVNVSAKQFSQPDFVKQVVLALYRFNTPPQLLKLELTEGMLVQNIEDTIRTMKELCRIGVGFSLDDFGTGYSSLQYLKRLPLVQIKIDQSFVRDIAHDAHDKSIVRTIIAMARNMELNVIAEGVETEEQQQILMNKGCSTFQGYYFGRPVPIDTFDAALKSSYVLQ
jgi:diguanylate cyclase (GGDEF)-like protein